MPRRKDGVRAITFEQWSSLSDSARNKIQRQWDPYADGYWHSLLDKAVTRFRAQYGSAAHVQDIQRGVYHCGVLIIGVCTDLPYPRKVELPESYAGFPVYQFGSAAKPKQRRKRK